MVIIQDYPTLSFALCNNSSPTNADIIYIGAYNSAVYSRRVIVYTCMTPLKLLLKSFIIMKDFYCYYFCKIQRLFLIECRLSAPTYKHSQPSYSLN